MISLYDGQLSDLLGAYYKKDTKIQALSHALREGMRLMMHYSDKAAVYTDISNMPEEVLDLLAAELSVQYYDASYPVETKRKLTKNAMRWHRIAGTKAAVEELASSIFDDCQVQEWFEYDGEPYKFRIIVGAQERAENVERFTTLLKKAKNLRSHLESVSILRSISTGGSHSVGIRTVVVRLPPIQSIAIQ